MLLDVLWSARGADTHSKSSRSEKVQDLARAGKIFKDLSDSEQNEVENYYTAKKRQLDRAQKVICRESSIQLVLQNSLIVYQGKI